MKLKALFPISLLFGTSLLMAEAQDIRIGTIDPHYKKELSSEQLRLIIDDIQSVFEQHLGMQVITYAAEGKPIDILYVPPSRAKKDIAAYTRRVKQSEQKVQRLQQALTSQQEELNTKSSELDTATKYLNIKVTEFNNIVASLRKEKRSPDEIKKYQIILEQKQKELEQLTKSYRQAQKTYNQKIKKYNIKVSQFNAKVRAHQRLSRKLERMIKSYREVKGAAIGYKEHTFKTFGDGTQSKKSSV